jgi:hypothetical protein
MAYPAIFERLSMVELFRNRFFAVSIVIMFALVFLSGFSPQAGGQTPQGTLILDPQLVNIMQGYGFNINVTLQDVTNLAYFNTHLTFNTSRISLQTYAYHDGWSEGCGSESGGLVCSGGPSSGSFTGSTVVVTITFGCVNAGSSQIAVSTSFWAEAPYGGVFHDFAVTQGATVNQAAPATVTVTTTSNVTTTSAFTTISTTTATTSEVSTTVLTSWGYLTLPRTTTVTSLITSIFTSVITSVSTASGSTVTSTLTSVGTRTISTTSTVTSETTAVSLITIAETKTGTPSAVPLSPPHCVIATAAYGSALAPEVVYMRYVRDQLIGSTPSGRVLVGAFNAFYYSWSPALAEWIAESALLRALFRVLLLPLVGIAHATVIVFMATARATGQTAAASLFAFLAAAIMTIIVYVFFPIMVAARLRQAIRRLRT